MADIWMDVDAALSEVPVNILPLIDATDFKTRKKSVAYNAAGLELIWHFTTTAGATSATVVTPTTGGAYDWAHQDGGMYTIEIPASGGASINNDSEGFGWFTGIATGVLPWRGPIIGFRAAGLNNLLIDDAYSTTRGLAGTALPDAAADAAGGLPISDAGGLDLDTYIKRIEGAITATILGRIDAAISTRSSHAASDVKTAVEAAGSHLALIKAKTDNLPASPAAVGSAMTLADDAITAAKFDESTAFPLKSADTGATAVARTGADSDTLETLSDEIAAVTAPTAAAVADAVWDEAVADHAGVGSTGAALAAAGGSGDPWATALPGAYGAGTAGKIVGDNLNATVSSRSSHDAAAVKTAIEAAGSHLALIKAKTDNLTFTVAGDVDCNVQSWKGSAAADMTGDAYARLGAPAGASVSADVAAVKSETAAIVADTNELQTDLTNGGRLDLILDGILEDTGTTLDGKIDTIDGNVDSILADTNELQTDWANGGRLDLLIDAIKTITDAIGATGSGLSAVPWNAAWDSEVQSEVQDAITASSLPTAAQIKTAIEAAGSHLALIKAKTDLGLINTTWTDAKAAYLDEAISAAKTLTAAYDDAKTAAQPGDKMDLIDAPNATALTALAVAILDTLLSEGDADALNARTVRSALRALRNKSSIAAGVLTVCKENDSDSAWTGAVTTDGAAEPITVIDPT